MHSIAKSDLMAREHHCPNMMGLLGSAHHLVEQAKRALHSTPPLCCWLLDCLQIPTLGAMRRWTKFDILKAAQISGFLGKLCLAVGSCTSLTWLSQKLT